MFICIECNKKCRESSRVFESNDSSTGWCRKCYNIETKRSIKEDSVGSPYMRTRPPKYMLQPKEYAVYGYEIKPKDSWSSYDD